MGHILVVLVSDEVTHYQKRSYYYSSDREKEQHATFLAFDLEYHSIQEVEILPSMFVNQEDSSVFLNQHRSYSFIKYDENQIIKYSCQEPSLHGPGSTFLITIESFERILLIF